MLVFLCEPKKVGGVTLKLLYLMFFYMVKERVVFLIYFSTTTPLLLF